MQLLPVGLAAAGSLIGNKLAKAGTGPTAAERSVLANDQTAQNRTLAAGTQLAPQAGSLIGMGAGGYQPVLNYWSKILSGNRADMTSAMAPELNRIAEGYSTATNTSAALNPRGGPSTEFNAELPYAQQRDVTNVLQQARPQAAAGLLSTAASATGAGSNLFANATNSILSSTAAGRDILNNEQLRAQRQAENAKGIGRGLFDLISKYGPDIIGLLQRGGGLKQGPMTREPIKLPGQV